MSTPNLVPEEEIAEQAIAAVNAQFVGMVPECSAVDLDDVPAGHAANYVEVTVTRISGGNRRVSSAVTPSAWRITTRAVARHVGDTRELLRRTRTGLEYARLVVQGVTSTPVQFESADPVEQDKDSTWSGFIDWTVRF